MQDDNRPSTRLRVHYHAWVNQYFSTGNFFDLTLTFRSYEFHFSKNYIPNYQRYSSHVKHFLNITNRSFLGSHDRKNDRKLKTIWVFEQNESYGVHFHMILENPTDCRIPEHERVDRLYELWMGMRCSGVRGANLIRECKGAPGWISYQFKGLNSNSTDKIFPELWHFGDETH